MGRSLAQSMVCSFCFFMAEREIWAAIPGLNGKYLASSFGRIKSVYGESLTGKRRTTDTILKPSINCRGYYTIKIILRIDGRCRGKTFKVHRLVALAFHPNPLNKPQINHKDLNQLNNHKDNLEWATAKENTNHAQINGRRPTGIPRTPVGEYPKRYKKVRNIKTGIVYASVYELSKLIKVKPKELRRRLSGERSNNTPYEYIPGEYSLVYQKNAG